MAERGEVSNERRGGGPGEEIAAAPAEPVWHALSPAAVLERLATTGDGLAGAAAARRLERHGPNRLPSRRRASRAAVFLRQFNNPLILVLGLAALVSVLIGEHTDAAFILAVLLLNGFIGGYQEWRAEESSRALERLLRGRATVIRDGEELEIDAELVVPGDVCLLESGNRVPADLRLLAAHGLSVDESLLTGESLPVSKDAEWSGGLRAPLGDRRNMAFAGSMVARGRGKGIAVATGTRAEVGRLALEVAAAAGGEPPLLIRIGRFTRVIGLSVLGAAVAVGGLGAALPALDAGQMFLFAVALAVSAIPEGLPIAMTVALAVAATRMAKRSVIVRRLAAVEGLGSCTLIATDKTGTLTKNELTVGRIWTPAAGEFEVTGSGYAPDGEVCGPGGAIVPGEVPQVDRLARIAALCNEAWLHRRGPTWVFGGDPTDVALLSLALKLGVDRQRALDAEPLVNQIPFEPERKYAASFHRSPDGLLALVKGAPERVLAMCTFADPGTGHAAAAAAAQDLAGRGFRVLALAGGPSAAGHDPGRAPEEPAGLALVGLAGMIDPLRPRVREAVAACRQAGIAVTMVTGDHPVTALAIARDLGMAESPDEVVTGSHLMEMSAAELERRVGCTRIFARTSPHQKLAIVDAARRAGHFVAVTGDGVNYAPALKAAHIGVAMGLGGTDVAREAAELVLADDDFASIVNGVEEGRVAYDNVRKVIYLLISTGAAEVVLALLCLAAGMPLPLLPVQLLWLNLVTNGIQDVALAFEPKEADVLRRPPRPPAERIFDRLMIERTLLAALVMGLLGFFTFRFLLESGLDEAGARNHLLLLMVLFENVHIGNCRSETASLFTLSPFKSPILLAGTLAAFSIHVLVLYLPPARALLATAPVSVPAWACLLGLALLLALAMELHKLHWRRRRHR